MTDPLTNDEFDALGALVDDGVLLPLPDQGSSSSEFVLRDLQYLADVVPPAAAKRKLDDTTPTCPMGCGTKPKALPGGSVCVDGIGSKHTWLCACGTQWMENNRHEKKRRLEQGEKDIRCIVFTRRALPGEPKRSNGYKCRECGLPKKGHTCLKGKSPKGKSPLSSPRPSFTSPLPSPASTLPLPLPLLLPLPSPVQLPFSAPSSSISLPMPMPQLKPQMPPLKSELIPEPFTKEQLAELFGWSSDDEDDEETAQTSTAQTSTAQTSTAQTIANTTVKKFKCKKCGGKKLSTRALCKKPCDGGNASLFASPFASPVVRCDNDDDDDQELCCSCCGNFSMQSTFITCVGCNTTAHFSCARMAGWLTRRQIMCANCK